MTDTTPKKRGRSPRANPVHNSKEAALLAAQEGTKDERGNRKRVPLGRRKHLEVGQRFISPGYVGRWVEISRLAEARDGWYEVIIDPDTGEQVRRTKGESTLILMQIEEQYWREDQEAKLERVVDTTKEAAKIDASKGEYSPLGRDYAVSGQATDDPLGLG